MNQSKVISVWGSGSSGKTTVAIKLAASLAKTSNVLLLFCGSIGSPMSLVTPKEARNKSVGKLLSEAFVLTDRMVLRECVLAKKIDKLAFLGYDYGETAYSYPEYFEPTVISLIQRMQEIADYVIIDCSTDIGYDLLSAAALKMSDKVIRVCEPTIKSMLYFDSMIPLLEGRIRTEDEIKVLNKVKEHQESDLAIEKYQGINVLIEYHEAVERQFDEGTVFMSACKFDTQVEKIISLLNEEIFVEEEKEIGDLLKKIVFLFGNLLSAIKNKIKDLGEYISVKRSIKNCDDEES